MLRIRIQNPSKGSDGSLTLILHIIGLVTLSYITDQAIFCVMVMSIGRQRILKDILLSRIIIITSLVHISKKDNLFYIKNAQVCLYFMDKR